MHLNMLEHRSEAKLAEEVLAAEGLRQEKEGLEKAAAEVRAVRHAGMH
jgi:hypothetical protein